MVALSARLCTGSSCAARRVPRFASLCAVCARVLLLDAPSSGQVVTAPPACRLARFGHRLTCANPLRTSFGIFTSSLQLTFTWPFTSHRRPGYSSCHRSAIPRLQSRFLQPSAPRHVTAMMYRVSSDSSAHPWIESQTPVAAATARKAGYRPSPAPAAACAVACPSLSRVR
jgi:hypothetical protein